MNGVTQVWKGEQWESGTIPAGGTWEGPVLISILHRNRTDRIYIDTEKEIVVRDWLMQLWRLRVISSLMKFLRMLLQ